MFLYGLVQVFLCRVPCGFLQESEKARPYRRGVDCRKARSVLQWFGTVSQQGLWGFTGFIGLHRVYRDSWVVRVVGPGFRPQDFECWV